MNTATETYTTAPCVMCNGASTVKVSSAGLKAWLEGEMIQNALPELSNDQRELLISGTHPSCWEELMG